MPRPTSPYRQTSSFSFGPGPLSTALKAIIGANVVMFLATTIWPSLQLQLGLVPMWVLRDLRVYQPVTYMFIHAGLFHVLFNMLALWMFGTELERVWGTRFFVKFYFVTGIGAGCLTVLLSFGHHWRVRRGVRSAPRVRDLLPQASDLHVFRVSDSGEDLRPHHGRDRVFLVDV
jgi:hypothetical protein